MSDLRELYQEVILDHNKSPRNCRVLDEPDARHAEGYNPLCGDRLTVYVGTDGDVLRDVSFTGEGCAISQASASLMTEALKGLTRAEIEKLKDAFIKLVTTGETTNVDLGKLRVLGGVHDFPMRVKCATLAWHTLNAALNNDRNTATTE